MDLLSIKDPSFLKTMNTSQLKELSKEIRSFLIENLSKTGGHIGPNLGVVELTIALHKCFDSPKDKFLWDVGHQSYVHKILTGRADQFTTLRQYKGLSGFPKMCESEHDVWKRVILQHHYLLQWEWRLHAILKRKVLYCSNYRRRCINRWYGIRSIKSYWS